jgi:hypothetical protein
MTDFYPNYIIKQTEEEVMVWPSDCLRFARSKFFRVKNKNGQSWEINAKDLRENYEEI